MVDVDRAGGHPPALRFGAAILVAAALAWGGVSLGAIETTGTQLQLSLILGALFGFVLQRSRFCFFCIWKDWLERRDPAGLLGLLAALAIGIAGYTLLFGAWLPDPSGTRLPPTAHIGPVGPALVLGGLAFGAGMTISGSCISAHLYRLGEGSPTAPFALVGAAAGFVLGFVTWNPLYLAWTADAPVLWLPRWLGYGGTLAATLLLLGALALLLLRTSSSVPAQVVAEARHPVAAIFTGRWPAWLGGLAVGAIGVASYLRLAPLGVTAELGSRSREAATGLGWMPERLEGLDQFRGCATAIRDSLLTPNGMFVLGLVGASLAAALAADQFRPQRPTVRHASRGLAGGVLLGWGAMTALGCTVGTLLSGIMAGAVSGWVFAISVALGATLAWHVERSLARG
jgi:uncharacterized membrane protein YedE/YeeE